MKNKVNILGTEWRIEEHSMADDPYLRKCDGYIDKSVKLIVIGKKESDCELQDFSRYQKSVIRHEVIHAYFEEAGLSSNVENKECGVPETYVDWFAIQFPKIFRTFAELDVVTDEPCEILINSNKCESVEIKHVKYGG